MALISNVIFYILMFLSVYVQVFFFVTFLENRKKIITRNKKLNLEKYEPVTIVVPCWNEELTVFKTVKSLLDSNYPKEKLQIFLIDDGSTDGTLDILNKFKDYPNVKVFSKENGGKYTALNLGLQNLQTDFFGCLDADSYADTEALVRIMTYFEKDPTVMAVVPSMVVSSSKNIIQGAQQAEYYMGVYFKKMLGFIGAIHVTPGPLTIFRRKVFDDLGNYRHGHNTEDMEMAYRMQKSQYKIDHCNDAFVYTNTPATVLKLYKQRLRWIFGFINNTFDYRDVVFRKKYGNFAIFTLPTGVLSIFSVSYIFGKSVYNFGDFLYSKIVQFQALGLYGFNFTIKNYSFDPFFFNTQSFFLLVVVVYCLVIFSMVFGRRMAEGKWHISLSMFYFFPIFGIIAPFWLLKAVYNTAMKRKPSWR